MCNHGDTVNGRDRCIEPLIAALNAAGIATVASCCGHGHRPGVISLADGRELIVAQDYNTARQVEASFPLDIHGQPSKGIGPWEYRKKRNGG
jgi:hypothetical protein